MDRLEEWEWGTIIVEDMVLLMVWVVMVSVFGYAGSVCVKSPYVVQFIVCVKSPYVVQFKGCVIFNIIHIYIQLNSS